MTKWALQLGEGKPMSATEVRQHNITRDVLRQQYSDYLNDNQIDFF